MITLKVITMPNFDKIDYALMVVIAILAICCYLCYTKNSTKPEPYAPLAYFTVADPKYQVPAQNVMSAPIVYKAGPVSPVADEPEPVKEGFQYPMPEDIKTIVPAHLNGGFVNPLSNPQMGGIPGTLEYGVSAPAMGNLSASISNNSSPGSLNVWSTVI